MKQNRNWLMVIILALVLVRCGVKGDPVAPETPAPIGRGRPTFKKAFEDIKVEAAGPEAPDAKTTRKPITPKQNEDGESDEDNENED